MALAYGQRVYRVIRYGAGLEKKKYGVVTKLGHRGVRVKFDDGEELFVQDSVYPVAQHGGRSTSETTAANTATTATTATATTATTTGAEMKQAASDALGVGDLVVVARGGAKRYGTVQSLNDRFVTVAMDGGKVEWPKRKEVTLVSKADATRVTAAPAAPAPAVEKSPDKPAATVAPAVVTASAPAPVQAQTPVAAGANGKAVDWVSSLAAHAATLLDSANSSVQSADADLVEAERLVENARREVAAAQSKLDVAVESAKKAKAHAVSVAGQRDALVSLVRNKLS